MLNLAMWVIQVSFSQGRKYTPETLAAMSYCFINNAVAHCRKSKGSGVPLASSVPYMLLLRGA